MVFWPIKQVFSYLEHCLRTKTSLNHRIGQKSIALVWASCMLPNKNLLENDLRPKADLKYPKMITHVQRQKYFKSHPPHRFGFDEMAFNYVRTSKKTINKF